MRQPLTNASRRAAALAVALLAAAVISGCLRRSDPAPSGPVVAIVNGDKITRADLERELSVRAKQDPSFKITPAAITEQLEVVINRRLLIQEAVRRKLAEEDRFVQTIRNFWEQTLVKRLTEVMGEEFRSAGVVPESQVQAFVARLDRQVTFDIARRLTAEEARALIAAAPTAPGEPAGWDETLGPVTYDRLTSTLLEQAFDELAPGASAVYERHGIYYAVRLRSSEPVPAPDPAAVSPQIRRLLAQRRQRLAFEAWLEERRAQAKVEVRLEEAAR